MVRIGRGALLGALGLVVAAGAGPAAAEEVVLKLWSRADRSGPLRAGNIVEATKAVNAWLAAAGTGKSVKLEVFEGTATGYDADALELLKACAVDRCPDFYVAAHEWVGEFAKSGYAMALDDFVERHPWAFDDMIPVFWESTKYQGKIYAIPQDSESRMFFYNKDMLRKIGKDEAFVEGLPEKVVKGEFTMMDLSRLAQEEVQKGAAQMGILHRPNVGSDYLMSFAAFGVRLLDEASGKLLLPRKEMKAALGWFDWNARNGVTPPNNTQMSWDEIQSAFKQEKAFAYHHGVWTLPEFQLGEAKGATWPKDRDGYFKKIGWILAPPAEKGGEPKNLSHPIVYVVNPKSKQAELAALIVAQATLPYYNTKHAVSSGHTAILHGQASMPAYADAWYLQEATKLLPWSAFIPNHPEFGRYNQLIFKALQGVETGRLEVDQAIEFLEEETARELEDQIKVLDQAG